MEAYMILDIAFISVSFLFIILFSITFIRSVKNNFFKSIEGVKISRGIFILFSGIFILFGSSRQGDIYDIYIFLNSIYCSAKLFLVDGSLTFQNINNDMTIHIRYLYLIMYYIVCFLAASFSAYTILSFFKNVFTWFKLRFWAPKRNLCIFNELNDKSLTTAREMLNEHQPLCNNCKKEFDFFTVRPDKDKTLIVFCNVNSEISGELQSEANSIGAICVNKSAVEVHKLLRKGGISRKSSKRLCRYFLFGQNETKNLRHAIEITDFEKMAVNKKEKPFDNLGIFVSASGDANGLMIDSLNMYYLKDMLNMSKIHNRYFVRRIDPALMMALNVIVFNTENHLAKKDDPDKDLTVVVAGMGQYGFEIVKTLCWYYQRKTGSITIHIVDKSDGIEDLAREKAPELVDYTIPSDRDDDAVYQLIFHESIDVFGDDFVKLICELEQSGIDAVFVTLGDDTINTEAAINIRKTLDRCHYSDICYAETVDNCSVQNVDFSDLDKSKNNYLRFTEDGIIDGVKICAVVHSDEKALSLNADHGFSYGNYNIDFVGMDSKVYTCENIYNFNLENQAIVRHSKNSGTTPTDAINSYNANEHDRSSSIASTEHKKYIRSLYGELSNTDAAKIENKRWNTFMRSCGYIAIDKNMTLETRNHLFETNPHSVMRRYKRGKWHNSIAPFSELGKTEQDNNIK